MVPWALAASCGEAPRGRLSLERTVRQQHQFENKEEVIMATGTIKRVVADRGFGFIADDGAKEYFFHRNSLDRPSTSTASPAASASSSRSSRAPRARERTGFAPPPPDGSSGSSIDPPTEAFDPGVHADPGSIDSWRRCLRRCEVAMARARASQTSSGSRARTSNWPSVLGRPARRTRPPRRRRSRPDARRYRRRPPVCRVWPGAGRSRTPGSNSSSPSTGTYSTPGALTHSRMV